MSKKHIVAAVHEIPVGQRKIIEINGRSIGIFNIAGEFFALLNRCPHAGGELCTGTITGLRQADLPGRYQYSRPGEIIRCPWHGWEFDIKSGKSWFDPQKVRVKPYPVTVEQIKDQNGNEDSYQQGPYEATTFPVSIESSYVVVHM